MKIEDHAKAKQLLIAHRVEGISDLDRQWLQSHLAACDECSAEAGVLQVTVAAVRSVSATVPDDLLRRTRLAVERRAQQLQAQRESQLPFWVSVVMATISGILVTPYMWSLFASAGRFLQISDVTWQVAFFMSWFLPATVLAGVAAWRFHTATEMK